MCIIVIIPSNARSLCVYGVTAIVYWRDETCSVSIESLVVEMEENNLSMEKAEHRLRIEKAYNYLSMELLGLGPHMGFTHGFHFT
jgi:hypothetical protein